MQTGGRYKLSRVVTLPDYQGAGVGLVVTSAVAALHRKINGSDVYISMAHPGMISALNQSRQWALVNQNRTSPHRGKVGDRRRQIKAPPRPVYISTFLYVGPKAA